MIFIAVIFSFLTAAVEFYTKARLHVLIPYGIIVPLFFSTPRIFYFKFLKNRDKLNKSWYKTLETFGFYILILNAPASLILHSLGFQFDRFLHLSGVFFITLISFIFAFPHFMREGIDTIPKPKVIFTTFILGAFFIFGAEFFQFAVDAVFGTKLFSDAAQTVKIDLAEDIIFGFAGLGLALLYLNFSFYKFLVKFQKTERQGMTQ